MPPNRPHSISSSSSVADSSPENIISPEQLAQLPDFFDTALPKLVPTPPEKEGANEGTLYPGEPWVRADVYTLNCFPLHARHFNTEEGFRPLSFVRFIIQDEEPYVLGAAGKGEKVYRHLLYSYRFPMTSEDASIDNRKDLPQLRDDYPFAHLIEMSLISINDPGVFADVYRYRHLVDQQRILDIRKRGLRSFHTWYNDNRDTLDFVSHNQDHTEASKLLLSFHAHYKKEADQYNLDVKRFGNLVQEIEGRLVDARVMQYINAHNFHVWKAIEVL